MCVEHTDASDSCVSSSRSLGPAPPMPDPLRTVYCTLCSLNVYLGKASNPNCGLDKSWLGKSAVLIKDHQTGEKRKEGEKTQSCSIPGGGMGEESRVGRGVQGKDPWAWFNHMLPLHSLQMSF